jgi:hypothetical protein
VKLSGKDFYVFQSTFSDQFLDILSILMPQTEAELFGNELMAAITELNLKYIKKFTFAFVLEC